MIQTKTQKILRYGLYGLLILGIAAVLVYFLVIRTVQIHNQKQNFAKAEASLDALEKQIEAKIGKPDQIKKERSCDRANLLSKKGPLGCDISFTLTYENENADNSNTIMNRTLPLGTGNVRIGSGATRGKAFIQNNTLRGTQIFYQDLLPILNITCAISYRYPSDQTMSMNQESLVMVLSCGGPAMSEYFPVKN